MISEPAPETTVIPEGRVYRQCYENGLQDFPAEERMALARTSGEPVLSALCFDPQPQVIASLFENPRLGLVQARLVARHHRSAAGLEILGHTAFVQDEGVRRGLLQNPILPQGLFHRIWVTQRLLALYHVVANRDLPERTRGMAKDLFRAAFHQRPAEEQVELILISEGRCLAVLGGTALDSRAAALLCRRPLTSTLLVENLARWNATPPMLINHLLRQEAVRRNAALRRMIERHPNAQAARSEAHGSRA